MTTSEPDREGRDGDVPVPPEPDPRPPLDVDTEFAAIVAAWETASPDHPWPDAEDVGPLSRPEPLADRPAGSSTGAPPDLSTGQRPDQLSGQQPGNAWDTAESRSIRPAVPDPFTLPPARAEAELEDRFIPPEPPPLPRGDLIGRVAWACVLGGPLFLLVAAMVWRDAPQLLVLGAVGAFIGGFVTLVLRLPQHRDDDGDDGAVV